MPYSKASWYLSRFFWLWMCLWILVGCALLLGSIWWQSSTDQSIHTEVISKINAIVPDLRLKAADEVRVMLSQWEHRLIEERFGPAVMRDLAIALLIAAIVTVTIELYAGEKLRSRIAEDVLQAVYMTVVPRSIYQQVADSIFRATVVKRDWQIHMTLRPSNELGKDNEHLYISKTVISQKFCNLLARPQPDFPVSCELDEDVTKPELDLPRFTKVTIAGDVYEGERLDKIVDKSTYSYRTLIDLPGGSPDDYLQVVNEIEEIVRVPDTFVWSTPYMTEGITRIIIDTTGTPELQFKVFPLHANRKALEERVKGRQWDSEDGILPWQGIEVVAGLKKDATAAVVALHS
jgi:hypothetical protein